MTIHSVLGLLEMAKKILGQKKPETNQCKKRAQVLGGGALTDKDLAKSTCLGSDARVNSDTHLHKENTVHPPERLGTLKIALKVCTVAAI